MFICDKCGKSSLPGAPMTRVVVETRERIPPKRGTEIVRELKLCQNCAGDAPKLAARPATASTAKLRLAQLAAARERDEKHRRRRKQK